MAGGVGSALRLSRVCEGKGVVYRFRFHGSFLPFSYNERGMESW